MNLSAQYYRPPFPDRRRWAQDMADMRAAGLRCVYLWACWGWIEPEPGRFEFDDYDELIRLAAEHEMRVVINVIAEIHPFWIHREVPDSRMLDHRNQPVASIPRRECNVGLTPGGCFDNPRVNELMMRFVDTLARRYADQDHLYAYDLWNETRWGVHADGHVCYCPHTLDAFHRWLDEQHGGLSGVEAAWRRRYADWADVDPGRVPGRTFTELQQFQAFLTWRSARHMQQRCEVVRAADPRPLLVAHAGLPATHSVVNEWEQAISRGNDWDYTDVLDGFGASVFPSYWGWDNCETGAFVQATAGAATASGKRLWIGEVQGGSARVAIEARESVTGRAQQRWVWTTVARGAKDVNFWCWRDEVFGRESNGWGIAGHDGCAESRIAELRRTGELFERHGELLDAYRPDQARVAVVFDPDNHQLDWAQSGREAKQSQPALEGVLTALERLQIPYDVLESRHRAKLPEYRVVLMPWPLIVDPGLAEDLLGWVRAGGTLLAESELDAYDRLGFYRYADERPFANALGVLGRGRRTLDGDGATFAYELDGERGELPAAVWTEPLRAADGSDALVTAHPLGAGRTIAIGSFPSIAHRAARSTAFEQLLGRVVEAGGGLPELRCGSGDGEVVQWRTGRAGDERLLFVTNTGPAAELEFSGALLAGALGGAQELVADRRLTAEGDAAAPRLVVPVEADGHAIVRWRD